MEDDPDVPPGWSHNPSSWSHRLPIVGLASLGFGVAFYLALYQWRVLERVWEPFFPGQSEKILRESWISQLLGPVPDAFLGALGYAADAVTGAIGGTGRWRTMPWLVVLFGILVVPLGAVSVALVMSQPLLFDAWCTLCLCSAAISLLMIGPATDEVLASLQYLRRASAAGLPFWQVFWKGGARLSYEGPEALPAPAPAPWGAIAAGAAAAIGVWLLASPTVLGYDAGAGETGTPAALAEMSDRIAGPVITTFSTVAVWEVARPARWVSLAAGCWLAVAPVILGLSGSMALNSALSGIAVIALSLVRGRPRLSLGGGWPSLW